MTTTATTTMNNNKKNQTETLNLVGNFIIDFAFIKHFLY